MKFANFFLFKWAVDSLEISIDEKLLIIAKTKQVSMLLHLLLEFMNKYVDILFLEQKRDNSQELICVKLALKIDILKIKFQDFTKAPRFEII